mmetsp:Transcript_20703/g.57771  ORF Transcript_20703/g.57771 Transcript_20703/m.57771 type:complete len:85 (-) Transcript_20703:54-308(-)
MQGIEDQGVVRAALFINARGDSLFEPLGGMPSHLSLSAAGLSTTPLKRSWLWKGVAAKRKAGALERPFSVWMRMLVQGHGRLAC